MRSQSDPKNGKQTESNAAPEMVCSAEFTQGCVEPLEDEQPVEAAAPQTEEIYFSETVCSAEFQGGCIEPEDEAERA